MYLQSKKAWQKRPTELIWCLNGQICWPRNLASKRKVAYLAASKMKPLIIQSTEHYRILYQYPQISRFASCDFILVKLKVTAKLYSLNIIQVLRFFTNKYPNQLLNNWIDIFCIKWFKTILSDIIFEVLVHESSDKSKLWNEILFYIFDVYSIHIHFESKNRQKITKI